MACWHEANAYRASAATAVDGAEDVAVFHFDEGVAAQTASGKGFRDIALATAKHVAFQARVAVGANDQVATFGLADQDLGVFDDVAVLAAAKHGAVDEATRYGDVGVGHVGPSVESGARVALTGTKEVAGKRELLNLLGCAWHTDGAATHHDSGFSFAFA